MWYMYYPDLKPVNNLPFYTVSIGLHVWQWPVSRNEGYPYPQFLYSEHGHGILDIYGEKMALPEHSAFFLPANVPHSYYPQTDRWDVRWFVPAGSGVTDLLHTFGFDKAIVYPLQNVTALDDIHNKIHMTFQLNTPESIFYSASYTYEYLFEFYKQYQQQSLPASVPYRKRLLPVLEYIEHHYAEPLTQKTLCQIAGVSSQHLCRMFQYSLNRRPMEYLAHCRIQAACNLLIHTDKNIEEISYEVGFNNTNYFCKIFKKQTQMTPGNYRVSHRTAP